MDIKAFKMDGLGNDFVIIDQRYKEFDLTNNQIKKICNRDFIGCDQLIVIKKSPFDYLKEEFDPDMLTEIHSKLDDDNKIKSDNIKNIHEYLTNINASLKFYNSDGSISGACGNGTRCVANLISKEKNNKTINLTTLSGNLKSEILENNLVTTKIGKAKTKWNEIPLFEKLDTLNMNIKINDKNNNEHSGGTAVNVGNPHLIFFVDEIKNFDIKIIGPQLENHKIFPEKCNITIAQIINNGLIKVKVWERGAGLTKACGTAACATAFAGILNNLTKNNADIEFETGKLSIFVDEENSIHMKGPVSEIKEISIKL